MFEVQRWTKQGDPLGSLLFNTVPQATLDDDLGSWREKGVGISLGDHQTDRLSNLRFADERAIILYFVGTVEKSGDRLQKKPRKSGAIDNIKVEVLPISEKAKHLGQTITFKQQETIEVKSWSH